MRQNILVAAVITLLISSGGLAAQNKKPKRPGPLAPIQDQAGLPRVLLIGDSISRLSCLY